MSEQTGYKEQLQGSETAPRRAVAACILLLIVISGCISWANYSWHFDGFILNDYHEYCQIARNFAEGRGYSTSVLRPIAYQFFQTLPQPEVTRMPLYPFFLSLFFRAFGASDSIVVLFNSISYTLLIVVIFLLALELSRSLLLSLSAAIMTAFLEANIRFTVTAEPNIFYAAALAGFFYYYLLKPDRTFIHGLLLGLLQLIRANTMFVMAGFFVLLFFQRGSYRQRFTNMGILVAGIFVALSPYWLRNYLVIGKPFFSLYTYSLLLFTNDYPLYTIWTQVTNVDPAAYALSHPAELLQKSYGFLLFLLSGSVDFYKPLVLIIVAAGTVIRFRDSRLRFIKWTCMVSIIIQTILLLPVGPVPYYYMFFFPLLITVALINAQPLLKRTMPAALVLFTMIFIYTTVPYWKSAPQPNRFREIGEQVASMTGKNAIILTDIPWEIAWYADRRAVWLPYDRATLSLISGTLKPDFILLTGASYATYGGDIWKRMLQDPMTARSLGYEPLTTVQFQGRAMGLVFKSLQ
ncbi:MAG: glycosyltransferase family 39 protein [Nitrospirae bacterium]|nr:glycosyltransferase family 39 protein [Nitrospirota bacterium]